MKFETLTLRQIMARPVVLKLERLLSQKLPPLEIGRLY